MSSITPISAIEPLDAKAQLPQLEQVVADLLAEAKKQGASAAEAGVSSDSGLSLTVRLGEVETIDLQSDVFSLGAILCVILTGAPPYTGTRTEVIAAAREAVLEPAHRRLAATGIDAELIELACACLSPEPADRPADKAVLK